MKVILFHTPECPHYTTALAELNSVLLEEGVHPQLELIKIKSQTQAQILHFPGSPTIRINGEDVEGFQPFQVQESSMGCRLYRHNGKLLGWPHPDMIRQAVRKAKEVESSLEDWEYFGGCCG